MSYQSGHKRPSRFWFGKLATLVIIIVSFVLVSGSLQSRPQSADESTKEVTATDGQKSVSKDESPHTAKMLGAKSCRWCHPAEMRTWIETTHYQTHKTIADTPRVREILEALGIGRDQLNQWCYKCHAPQQAIGRSSHRIFPGVTCETCHGPAGGPKGWLDRHAKYEFGKKREEESEDHFRERTSFCDQAGMIRSVQLYEIAESCFRCHLVSNERLVNAGHKPITQEFELLAQTTGKIRHNHHVDQTQNAVAPTLWTSQQKSAQGGDTVAATKHRHRILFLIGKVIHLKFALNNLIRHSDPERDFFKNNAEMVVEAAGNLGEVLGEFSGAEITPPKELAVILQSVISLQPKDEESEEGSADKAEPEEELSDEEKMQALQDQIDEFKIDVDLLKDPKVANKFCEAARRTASLADKTAKSWSSTHESMNLEPIDALLE